MVFTNNLVIYSPLEDEIFEEPRNVTSNLHHRVGRFVKIQLRFKSYWILISEVDFDISPARGNYSIEKLYKDENKENEIQSDGKILHKKT